LIDAVSVLIEVEIVGLKNPPKKTTLTFFSEAR
jgi:hypothetical protein